MRKKWNLWLIVAVLIGLLAQACARPPEAEENCGFVMNADSQRVSWGENTPVILKVEQHFPAQYLGSIQSAIDEWNQSRGRELIRLGGIVESSALGQDGHNIIYWSDNWSGFKQGEQARTAIYWIGDRIFEADIRINARDFKFSAQSAGVPGRIDLQSLLVHEFGHVMGLEHRMESPSVMLPSLANGSVRRAPQKIDLDSLRCEY